MFEEYSTATGPANVVGIDLHTIWNVRADESYDISYEFSRQTSVNLHVHGGTGLMAMRTLAGKGKIYLTKERTLEAKADTLIILQWEQLERYHCVGPVWNFWWFEFTVTGPLHMPMDKVLAIRALDNEQARVDRACSLLRRRVLSERCVASATVVDLLYQWLATAQEEDITHPYKSVIEDLIDSMHKRLRPAWTVQEMAKTAHMSVRNFRQVFKAVTGQTPKSFYQHLRLSLARELLMQQQLSVSQVAYFLDFSSPYHFSREFRRFFGLPPSALKDTS